MEKLEFQIPFRGTNLRRPRHFTWKKSNDRREFLLRPRQLLYRAVIEERYASGSFSKDLRGFNKTAFQQALGISWCDTIAHIPQNQ